MSVTAPHVASDQTETETARLLVMQLSKQQRETLALVAQGLSNEEIARRLHRSIDAIKTRISRTLTALGCRNRTEATLIYLRATGQLVDPAEIEAMCAALARYADGYVGVEAMCAALARYADGYVGAELAQRALAGVGS